MNLLEILFALNYKDKDERYEWYNKDILPPWLTVLLEACFTSDGRFKTSDNKIVDVREVNYYDPNE